MMGGSSVDDDGGFTSPLNGPRTLVLVGRTGNGKSATGNSILGKREFKSRASSSGVTSTCEMRKTVLKDGQELNVIDTPGLFDSSVAPEVIGKEIVKCINMARDGIHAVLVVLSVRNRFSKEEEAAITSLRTLFGSKINDYMIVVFTGGDELEENDQTLEDFLAQDCPESLKETLSLCGDRCVLFDNRTKNQMKRAHQVNKLLSLVNMVLRRNGWKPYTDEIFRESKRGTRKLHEQTEEVKQEISELTEQMHKSYEERLKRITEVERSKALEEHKRNRKEYIEFLKSCDFITASSQWRKVQDRLEADESCLRLEKVDRLEIFQEYIRDLEKEEEEQRKLRMEELRKTERKNRDEFRKLMEGHTASGTLTSKTHWRDYCIKVKDLPAYLAVSSTLLVPPQKICLKM